MDTRGPGTAAVTFLVVCALLASGSQGSAAGPPDSDPVRAFLLDDAAFTFHLRSYLLDQTETSGGDPAAWALGGWLGYETGWLSDTLKLGAAAYTSQPLWAPENRSGSQLLLPDQQGYTVLGQAYAEVRLEDQVLTFYRQLVDQPEVNPHDSRMTPNTFEGGSLKGGLGRFSYYAAVLTAMKTRDSDEFLNMASVAGATGQSIMYLAGAAFAPVKAMTARTSLYAVPDILASSYSDAEWNVALADDAALRLSGQFMVQSGIGEERLTGPAFRSWMGGAKGSLAIKGMTLTAGYTFNVTDEDWQYPYGGWPGYTAMTVADFNRAGEKALLLGASLDFARLGIGGLEASASAALDQDVADDLPSQNEYDFTLTYNAGAFDGELAWLAPLAFSLQYALIDSDNTNGTSDRLNELRIILNYELRFKGSDL